MGFFKKQITPEIKSDYTKWRDDLGFLFLILERKKQMVKDYILALLSDQLSGNDMVNDTMVSPFIEDIVVSTMTTLSPRYIDFLLLTYFGREENLISFITEDVFNDIVKASIEKNDKKIQKEFSKKVLDRIHAQNTAGGING